MEEFLDQVILDNSVKDLLIFGGIVLVAILLSRPITRLFSFLIYRLFKGVTEKNRAKDYVDITRKSFTWMVIIFAIFIAFSLIKYPDQLNFNIYSAPVSGILMKLYQSAMAIIVTWYLLRLLEFVALLLMDRAEKTDSKADDQIILFMKDLVKVVLVIMAIFFVLSAIFQFNITSLLAGAGIVGLAVAFAAKESIENLFGSFAIFADKPFTVGDFVQVGSVMGTVEKVGFRSTRIRTLEKTWVTLPNRKIMESHSENLTLRTFRRVDMTIGVLYSSKIEQIKNIVKDIQSYIDEHELTNQDGIVGFHDFGESSLNIRILYFVQNMDWNTYIKTREQINFEIMAIVSRHGSDFAFPTRTIIQSNEEN